MGLVGPWLTTTNTKKKKSKTKSASLIEAEKRHEERLRKLGVGKTKLSGKGIYEIPNYKEKSCSIPLSNSLGNGTKSEQKRYSGKEIIGIGTMHKSNAVPITSQKSAEELSKMR